MGNDNSPTARSNTHVRNATGRTIRVFYSKSEMHLSELVEEVSVSTGVTLGVGTSGVSAGVTQTVGHATKRIFKSHERHTSLQIPPRDTGKFVGQGELYVSVFVEASDPAEVDYQIAMNYYIPRDRSFIVTANYGIKLQKYGAGLCVGDDGRSYCTPNFHSEF